MAAVLLFDTQRRRPLPRIFRERTDVLDNLRDREVVERYRLSREAIFDLHNLIKDDISSSSNRSFPVPPLTKLLVTLRYLAKGDFFSETGDLHGVSRSSVSRHVWQVVNSINERLENIKFPTSSADISNVKRGFYKVAGLPNCVLCCGWDF
ncbi:putative nuclease HARBI1 [Ruditapes philippinarum]|uniref:putative nuclease HARBI1 n=1 Tax=Ruditapes philippinarum TaxID=129788 RepID=UPI00295AA58B|nr:putative nuclease HARBI1 [Ruditapes philippinarum]